MPTDYKKFTKTLISNHERRDMLTIELCYRPFSYSTIMLYGPKKASLYYREENCVIEDLDKMIESIRPLKNGIIEEVYYTISPDQEQIKCRDLIYMYDSHFEGLPNKSEFYEKLMFGESEYWSPIRLDKFESEHFSTNLYSLFERELLFASTLYGTTLYVDYENHEFALRMGCGYEFLSITDYLAKEFLIDAIEKFTRDSHPVWRHMLADKYLFPHKHGDWVEFG
jgi:hypothetical protein